MKQLLMYLAVAIALSINAQARLGETLEQCKERYGKIASLSDDMHSAQVGDYSLIIWTESGVCTKIIYSRVDDRVLTKREVAKIMDIYEISKDEGVTVQWAEDKKSLLFSGKYRAVDISGL